MAEVKERPILFNAESVKAILEGRKVQTRRVVKLPKTLPQSVFEYDHIPQGHFSIIQVRGKFSVVHWESDHAESILLKCPYEVGMNLWVRETWDARFTYLGIASAYAKETPKAFRTQDCCLDMCYRATCTHPAPENHIWMPSIFMPRWASRLALEVLDVRVTRVQDISEEDAVAEGCNVKAYPVSDGEEIYTLAHPQGTYRGCFAGVWDFINGKRGFGWDVNPWVFAISFRRPDL